MEGTNADDHEETSQIEGNVRNEYTAGKQVVKRKTWSTGERDAIMKHLSGFVLRKKLPAIINFFVALSAC